MVPQNICACGCGLLTSRARGVRFVHGHHRNTRISLIEKIHQRIAQSGPDECWLWPGALSARDGYGRVAYRGAVHLVHRAVLENKLGRPLGLREVSRHTCDVRGCCNPSHLLPGSRRDNSADMVQRGRQRRGERHPHAKITAAIAEEIRGSGLLQKQIAAMYGVDQARVSRIRAGKLWVAEGMPR